MARTHEVLPPSRLRAQRRKARIVKYVFFGVLFTLIIGGLIGASYIQGIRIRDVAVVGAESLSSEMLRDRVVQELSGKMWWVIPKNNVAVYSAAALQSLLLKDFPKLKSARVELDTFHSLQVAVAERVPVALWCGSSTAAEMSVSSACSFMDENGFVYEDAPEYSGTAYVRWYGVLGEEQIPAQYLEGNTFRSLQPLVESFRTTERTPTRVVVDENGDAFLSFAEGFQIRFTLTQKPEEVIASLRTAENSSVLRNKKLSDLQYLDLRFGNRLYYKFK